MGARRVLCSALLAVLAIGCAGAKTPAELPPYVPPTEWLTFDFDGREWSPGARARESRIAREAYTLPGETAETWTELVSVTLTYGAQRGVELEPLLEITKRGLEEQCPSLDWEVIEMDRRHALFTWVQRVCKDRELGPQTRIARIEFGRLGLHQVAYDAKTARMAPGLRRTWIDALRNAKLEPRNDEPTTTLPFPVPKKK